MGLAAGDIPALKGLEDQEVPEKRKKIRHRRRGSPSGSSREREERKEGNREARKS